MIKSVLTILFILILVWLAWGNVDWCNQNEFIYTKEQQQLKYGK